MSDRGDATAATPVGVEVTGLTLRYDETPALDDFTLDLPAGSVTALLGPSGCGKTTALRSIAGLERPSAGRIAIGDRVVTDGSTFVPTEQRQVGLVFQRGALFPHLDVAGNVGYGLPPKERKRGPRIDEMLALVGLDGFGSRPIDSLSGGQAQRVAVARALAPEPKVLLLDEPFANLDAVLRSRLSDEIAAVLRAAGVTALMVTHDCDEAFAVADRVAVMTAGRVLQAGSPEEVYRRPIDGEVAALVGDVTRLPDGSWARPESIELVADGTPGAWAGTVVRTVFLGADVLVDVVLDTTLDAAGPDDQPMVRARRRAADPIPEPDARVGIVAERAT